MGSIIWNIQSNNLTLGNMWKMTLFIFMSSSCQNIAWLNSHFQLNSVITYILCFFRSSKLEALFHNLSKALLNVSKTYSWELWLDRVRNKKLFKIFKNTLIMPLFMVSITFLALHQRISAKESFGLLFCA